MRIIGYCFNAAACCPDCTRAAFETGELLRIPINKPERLDQHRLPDDMINTDYEPVVPMFGTSYPDGFTCDECGEQA